MCQQLNPTEHPSHTHNVFMPECVIIQRGCFEQEEKDVPTFVNGYFSVNSLSKY